MKITINPVFDMRTGKLVSHDGQHEYSGTIVSFKGGTSQAQQNINTANGLESTLSAEGQAEQQQILPFLNQEMNNPQGFGQQGLNELTTAGGQATSGANANAVEQANLKASRSGNPSTSSSIIDAATRSAMQQQSNNALGINESNLQEKLAQQQAGEQGIAALSSGNISEALSSLGLSNQAVNEYINAYQGEGKGGPLGVLQQGLNLAGSVASGIGSGIATGGAGITL